MYLTLKGLPCVSELESYFFEFSLLPELGSRQDLHLSIALSCDGLYRVRLVLHGWTVPPRCARVEHPRNLAGTLCKAGNATRWKLSIYYNVDPFWDLVAIVAEV